ncbi:MAG: hypothetical protein QCI38_08095 [Candidatus Thermoplasmatota archaeon]|nr:hypothetical protein [Candidatus Thermoplasmatota archaeon]
MEDERKEPSTEDASQGKTPCPHPSTRSQPGPHPCPPHLFPPNQPYPPHLFPPNQPYPSHSFPPNHPYGYYYHSPPPPEKDNLVLIIVVLVVLVIVLPMVLAAGLFLMVQDIGHVGWDVDSLSVQSYETPDGWRISVFRGEVEISPSVDWYLLSPDSVRVGDRHNDTLASPPGTLFTYMDYNSIGYLDSGDVISINDPTHQYRGYTFHVQTASSVVATVPLSSSMDLG